ncbi:hypothetical protein V2A60_004079 [Cordyceps javanica]
MEPISVRDITADGNARIHVGNSSVTHVHNYADTHDQPEEAPVPFSLMPFSRDPDFIARGDILDQIATHCGQAAGRAALVGLGGVGKSQLAIEYSYQARDEKKDAWIFWVHAGTRARVEEGFRAIADAVKLPGRYKPKADIPQLLYTWLSDERNGKWLMILDSADDQEVFYGVEKSSGQRPLASYLPQSPNGAILVSTRDQAFAVRLTGSYKSIIKVGPMKAEEALSFLEKKLGALFEPDLGAELVSVLDCIPLAINQAASYIQARAPRSSIKKYLAEFRESEKKSAKLLAHDAAELRRDGSSSNAIMKTWQISFDHIRSKQPSAADLLALMSFFDNQSIPEAALQPEEEYDSDCDSDLESNWDTEELANHSSMKRLLEAKKRREAVDDGSEDDSASETGGGFEDDVALLRDYCLIHVNNIYTQFEMHRLVQLATKKWLKISKQHEEFRQLFIYRLALALPASIAENALQLRDLYTHMQVAIGYRPNKTNLRFWQRICSGASWYQGNILGQYRGAKQRLETATKSWQARKGAKHLDVLLSNIQVAGFMQEMDEQREAETLCTDALETLKATLPTNSHWVLFAMVELSGIYILQKRYEEAEELLLYAIDRKSALAGPEDRSILLWKSALARTYYWQDRLEEAESIELDILETSKRVFGSKHCLTISLMFDLASTYSEQSRSEEALTLQSQALELRSTEQHAEDQESLQIQAHVAQTYSSHYLEGQSMKLETDLFQKLTLHLGPNHEQTLDSMERLAGCLLLKGSYEEAENLYLQTLETSKSQLGRTHSRVIVNTEKLARLYELRKQPKKAENLLSDLLAALEADLGPKHSDTLGIMLILGDIYETMRQKDKAQDMWWQALSSYKCNYDMDHLAKLGCWDILARAEFDDLRKYQELENILEGMLLIRRGQYGPYHGDTVSILVNLALVKTSLGDLDGAATIHLQVLESYKTRFGDASVKTLTYMEHVIEIRTKQGSLTEAKELQGQVVEAWRMRFGMEHRKTLQAMLNLGEIYMDLGELTEAERLARDTLSGVQSLLAESHRLLGYAAKLVYSTVLKQAIVDESRRDEAVQLFEDYIKAFRRRSGDNTAVADCIMMGAMEFVDIERYEEACSMAETAFNTYKRLAGLEDPETLFNMFLLSIFWDDNGRYRESMALLRECVTLHQEVLGHQHPETEKVAERYARWVGELEEHVEEHADEQNHPSDSCEACLANKAAREHASLS